MMYVLTHPTEQPGEIAFNYFPRTVLLSTFYEMTLDILARYPFLRLSDIWFGEVGT